jgi:hypothetical protein
MSSTRVVYLSPSQFSTEYARFFGSAPTKDIAQLRGEGFDSGDDQRKRPSFRGEFFEPIGRRDPAIHEEVAASDAYRFVCFCQNSTITLIDSRSFIARYPSGTPSMFVTRSRTRPGSIRPSSTSGSNSSMYARTGAGPPAMVMLA